MSAAQLAASVVQFSATIIVTRLLTPTELGIFAVGAATAGMLAVMQAWGLQSFLVRTENLTFELASTACTLNLLISLILSICIFATGSISDFYNADVSAVLYTLAALPLIGSLQLRPAGMMERNGCFKQIAVINISSSAVGASATVLLALGGYSYMSFAYSQILSSVTTAILTVLTARQYASFSLTFEGWRDVLSHGSRMLTITGVAAASTRLSDIVLAHFLSLAALGQFNRAINLNGLIWNNIHLVIGRLVFVSFAQRFREGRSLKHEYLQVVELVTSILWPAFAGLVVLSGPLVFHLYGGNWTGVATPLSLLAMASIVQVSITMTWELFVATGQLNVQTKIETARAIIGISLFTAGCMVSLEAAAAARLLDAILALFIYRPFISRMTDTRMSDLWRIYLRSGLLLCLSIGPSLLLMWAYDWSYNVPIIHIFASVVSGCFLWLVGLALLAHPLLSELRRIYSKLLRS